MWVPTRNTSDQTPQPCRFHCSWAGPDRAGQVPSRRSILEAGRGGYTQDPFGPIEANPCRISLAIRPPTIVASTCAVPQSGLAAWGKKPITRRQRNALVSIPPCSSAASFPFRSFRPSGRHMQSASALARDPIRTWGRKGMPNFGERDRKRAGPAGGRGCGCTVSRRSFNVNLGMRRYSSTCDGQRSSALCYR